MRCEKGSRRIFIYAVAINYFLENEIHACADTIAVILNKA